jgi:2-keto-4-pentenoate hydratase
MVETPDTDAVAAALYDAYESGTPIHPLRNEYDLGMAEAYEVQRAVTERRRSAEGPPVGYKVGFTSEAIQADLGVEEPAYGRLLADTLQSEGVLDTGPLIEPRVEAELALRFGAPLEEPATTADVLAATEAVVPAIEVVDSRIGDWNVTAPEAVADNALSGRVVCGDRVRDPAALETSLALEGVEVRKNGERVATGVGADVLGHPGRVIEWLAWTLREHGSRIEAGDLVLTGSITPLVDLAPGDVVEARFASFGNVSLRAR